METPIPLIYYYLLKKISKFFLYFKLLKILNYNATQPPVS